VEIICFQLLILLNYLWHDLKDAAADSAPIVASIIGGTFGSSLGPMGTVAGSAVSAGLYRNTQD
jgi:hypothetical protein